MEPVKNNIQEDIEKHDVLNPLIWNEDATIKEEIADKIFEIVDEFMLSLDEAGVEGTVEDIILLGSNANYNYTKDSDLDIHIILNNADLEPKLADSLYGAYRSLFNKNYEINIYEIPVEVYVELPDTNRVSNGVYSVKQNKWISEPVMTEIPDLDMDKFEDQISEWEDKYLDLKADYEAELLEDETEVVDFINALYELRKTGLASDGEYGISNLIFKEMRNRGYLDNLKELKNKLISKRLSLAEGFLDNKKRDEFKNIIWRACGNQPIIYNNDIFYIYNVRVSEVERLLRILKSLDFVKDVQAIESGKYDFSDTFSLTMSRLPNKFYNIQGKIEIKDAK